MGSDPPTPAPGWAAAADRLEELQGVLPTLAELPPLSAEGAPATLIALADAVEALRRAGIRDQIQVAALQEMTESLLRERDGSTILVTLLQYIHRVFNLEEVLLLQRLPRSAGWIGFHATPEGASRRVGPVSWQSAWRTPQARPGRRAAPRSLDPEAYEFSIPLFGHSGSGTAPGGREADPIGLLCLATPPAAPPDREWQPAEIARNVEGVLEALWHREELEGESLLRRQLLEGMRDGLLAFDRDGAVLAGNLAAVRFLPRASKVSPDLPTTEELEEAAPALMEHLRAALDRGAEPEDCELLLGPPGGSIPTHVAVSRLHDEDGCFAGLVVNLTDLSHIRSMEEEIRRLDRLAALGRFAAGVAHEIRNPLAGIEAGVEYLAGRIGGEARDREDLRILRAEISRLNRIVSEMLDCTRPRPLQPQGVRVREIIERTTLAVAPIFSAQRQRLLLEGPRDLLIWADPDRLEQILINLTKNASEASPTGAGVRLTWSPQGTGSLLGVGIVFRIVDQGPGMAPEECARAFEPFYSTKGGGSGLGLSLSHAFAEQHGGRLHLESAPGHGTIAVLELPPGDPERVEPHASIPAGR